MSEDPATRLRPLADSLALDGFELLVGAPVGRRLHLRVVAGAAACSDCLIPEELFRAMAADRLGPGWDLRVTYPPR